jgi:putative cell wall-binding protein
MKPDTLYKKRQYLVSKKERVEKQLEDVIQQQLMKRQKLIDMIKALGDELRELNRRIYQMERVRKNGNV